jgi:TetR/AcrR family transcriptional regulator
MTRTTPRPARPSAKGRRPGRPGGVAHAAAIRAALLKGARELFTRRDFKAVSVRDIARKARVNPAMVHYHFGDKEGLYRAMLEETVGPILQRLQDLVGGNEKNKQVSIPEMPGIMSAMMKTLAHEPWLARLIVREVLAEEGPFREVFVREFAVRGGGRLPKLLAREIASGRVRADLDPTLGALSFMSMALFPFIALPVAEKVFGIRMTDAFAQRLVEHSTRMFYEGVGNPPARNTAQRLPVHADGSRRRTT